MAIFHSFRELAEAQGIKMPEPREEKPRKCFECGADMVRVGNSNVWVCKNEVARKRKDKTSGETVEVMEPCAKFSLARVG